MYTYSHEKERERDEIRGYSKRLRHVSLSTKTTPRALHALPFSIQSTIATTSKPEDSTIMRQKESRETEDDSSQDFFFVAHPCFAMH